MRNSLSTRLTYRIMAVVLVMMAVITSVVYYTVRSYMRDEARERYLGLLLKNHEEMRRRLSDVYVAVKNNVYGIERDVDEPDKLFSHVERIARLNPSIASCVLLFEPHYFPNEGRLFIPFARRDTTDRLRVMRVDSTYHSYIADVWLTEKRKHDESGWSDAYYESENFTNGHPSRLLATYAVPIHNHEGRPVAMLAADMSLDELRTHLMEDIQDINTQYEQGQGNKSYLFIVDREGTFIIHPDRARMLKPFPESLGKTMMTHRGTCETEVDGVMSRLYYRSIPHTDWVMVIVTPKDVILSNAFRLNTIILLTVLIGLVIIYFICRRQIKEIADPVALQKANLEHELKIASAIQMAMLPKSLNAEHDTLHSSIDLYASLTPAREVGGDLYDYFLRAGRLFFCIGDVSGKGVPASLLMAVMRAMFRGETRRAESAAAIVDTMNRNLSEEYTSGYFVTMFVGILDLTTGHLDYCNAGHEPPLILKRQPSVLNCKRNLPVGALSDWTYEGQQAQLEAGDMLFLYTDGLSEAQNTAGQLLGKDRIRQLAAEHTADTAKQLVNIMEAEVHRHANGARQNDDITLLAIKWQPSLTAHLSSSMTDIGRVEPFVRQAASLAGLNDREQKKLRLAVEEAVANIINHGQATTITLLATVEDEKLQLTIDDDGQPFDPTAESPTDLSVPADERPPGGMGVILIHKMADSLAYERVNQHNVLRIIKRKN